MGFFLLSCQLALLDPSQTLSRQMLADSPFLQSRHAGIDKRMITRYTLLKAPLLGAHLVVRANHRRQALPEHLAEMVLRSDIAGNTDEQVGIGIVPRDFACSLELHAEFDGAGFDLVEWQTGSELVCPPRKCLGYAPGSTAHLRMDSIWYSASTGVGGKPT